MDSALVDAAQPGVGVPQRGRLAGADGQPPPGDRALRDVRRPRDRLRQRRDVRAPVRRARPRRPARTIRASPRTTRASRTAMRSARASRRRWPRRRRTGSRGSTRRACPPGRSTTCRRRFAFAESLGLEPVWELDGVRTVRRPLRGMASRRHARRGSASTTEETQALAAAQRLADLLREHEADVLLDDLELRDVADAPLRGTGRRARSTSSSGALAPDEMPTTRLPSSHSSRTWPALSIR